MGMGSKAWKQEHPQLLLTLLNDTPGTFEISLHLGTTGL